MDLITPALQLLCGIAGSKAAAVAFPHIKFGTAGTVAAGVAGGLLGGQGLTAILGSGGDIVQTVAGSGSGGALLIVATGYCWAAVRR